MLPFANMFVLLWQRYYLKVSMHLPVYNESLTILISKIHTFCHSPNSMSTP